MIDASVVGGVCQELGGTLNNFASEVHQKL